MEKVSQYSTDLSLARMAVSEAASKLRRVIDHQRFDPQTEGYLFQSVEGIRAILRATWNNLELTEQQQEDETDGTDSSS
jgi:hypothetical protein